MVSMEYPKAKVIRGLPLPVLCSKIPKVQPLFTWSQRAAITLTITSSFRQWDRGRVKKDMLPPVKDLSQRSDTAPLLNPHCSEWNHLSTLSCKRSENTLFIPSGQGPS